MEHSHRSGLILQCDHIGLAGRQNLRARGNGSAYADDWGPRADTTVMTGRPIVTVKHRGTYLTSGQHDVSYTFVSDRLVDYGLTITVTYEDTLAVVLGEKPTSITIPAKKQNYELDLKTNFSRGGHVVATITGNAQSPYRVGEPSSSLVVMTASSVAPQTGTGRITREAYNLEDVWLWDDDCKARRPNRPGKYYNANVMPRDQELRVDYSYSKQGGYTTYTLNQAEWRAREALDAYQPPSGSPITKHEHYYQHIETTFTKVNASGVMSQARAPIGRGPLLQTNGTNCRSLSSWTLANNTDVPMENDGIIVNRILFYRDVEGCLTGGRGDDIDLIQCTGAVMNRSGDVNIMLSEGGD